MHGILHVYVSAIDFEFIDWAKKRFGRNFSRAIVNALKEYVGDEWTEARKNMKKTVSGTPVTVGPEEL